MNMLKTMITIVICVLPLMLTQCKSNTGIQIQEIEETVQTMEMRNPAFAKAKTTYNTYVAGVQGGGSGINMQFGWVDIPENFVMKEAYFKGMQARIQQGAQGYTAHFNAKQNSPEDMVMHSDPVQEATNTPPQGKKRFPVELTDKQVGIVYEENRTLVYTIINNPIEKPKVAYPSAPPRGEGY